MQTTCLVAAPDADCIETSRGTWILWGEPKDALAEAVTGATSVDEAMSRLAAVAQDASAVRLGDDDAVDAFRSVTATRSVYTLEADGRFVVTDNFRNALTELPVADRKLAPHAVTDHLLFRHPPEPDTHVAAVRALEHGTWFHRHPDGSTSVDVVDRLDARGSIGSGDPIGRLDAALAETLAGRTDVTNMLSGGVDSTLVHTYLGDVPSVQMRIDSPEFDYETEYARRARDLLGADAETVQLRESEFRSMLEASVDALGAPPDYNQTVLTDATFRRADPTRFVNAAGADSLYGLDGVKSARFASWFTPLFDLPGAPWAWRNGPGRVLPVGTLPEYASRLRRDPADPDSFVQWFPFFTDHSLVARVTDPRAVRTRCQRSLDYVSARVRRDASRRGFAAQTELAHLLSFFRHHGVHQWRELGHAHGHRLVAPFKHRDVVDEALDIPADRRYIEGPSSLASLTAKYVPKRLLGRRLPEYPVFQEKGAGSLPVDRYVESGPLADVFDGYDPPSFVPRSLLDEHVEAPGPLTWNLVTWAVWRDRVLRNPALERVDGTDEYTA